MSKSKSKAKPKLVEKVEVSADQIVFENGIDRPTRSSRGRWDCLEEMKVGESFLWHSPIAYYLNSKNKFDYEFENWKEGDNYRIKRIA